LPLLILGVVTALLSTALLVVIGRKRAGEAAAPPERPRGAPPPLPDEPLPMATLAEDAPPTADAGAICVRPGSGPKPQPPVVLEEEPAAPPPLPPDWDRATGGNLTSPTGRERYYRAAKGAVPPEVLALGQAERYHPPERWLTLPKQWPAAFIAGGVLLVLWSIALFVFISPPRPQLVSIFGVLGAPLGVALVVLPLYPYRLPTYVVFPDALVQVKGDEFTVLPWDAIAELNYPRHLVTCSRHQFELFTLTTDLNVLIFKIRERLMAVLLPRALSALELGSKVEFGKFTIAAGGISYRGMFLPWENVSRMVIALQPGQGLRNLTFWSYDSYSPWCEVDLNQTPNDWLLQEVVKQVCPKRLLVPVRA
jgi:hypothetical protein